MNIDHVVLWVQDPARALDFYVDVLGMSPVRAREFARGAAPFPSVRLNETTILDLMATAGLDSTRTFTGGGDSGGTPINHLCLALAPDEYAALRERLLAAGVGLTAGSARSFGARGAAEMSEYFRDPDGNVIEIRHYG